MLYTPLQMQNKLKEISGKDILLMLTNNQQRMITIKESSQGTIALRAHKMFLYAQDDIIIALGKWIGGDNREKERIKDYINANTIHINSDPGKTRKTTLKPEGRYYNLATMADNINDRYLGGRSSSGITWGRKVTRRRPTTIRLGWYDPMRNIITLSQRLDRKDIPHYMVEYVLFHEMLHEVIGIEKRSSGRRDIHSKKFKLMEQTYPFYNEARLFEKKKWGGA